MIFNMIKTVHLKFHESQKLIVGKHHVDQIRSCPYHQNSDRLMPLMYRFGPRLASLSACATFKLSVTQSLL